MEQEENLKEQITFWKKQVEEKDKQEEERRKKNIKSGILWILILIFFILGLSFMIFHLGGNQVCENMGDNYEYVMKEKTCWNLPEKGCERLSDGMIECKNEMGKISLPEGTNFILPTQ